MRCLTVHLHLGHLADAFIQSDLQEHLSEEGETTLDLCRYSKDVHRTKCQALTIVRLTHSLYTIKQASTRYHFNCDYQELFSRLGHFRVTS